MLYVFLELLENCAQSVVRDTNGSHGSLHGPKFFLAVSYNDGWNAVLPIHSGAARTSCKWDIIAFDTFQIKLRDCTGIPVIESSFETLCLLVSYFVDVRSWFASNDYQIDTVNAPKFNNIVLLHVSIPGSHSTTVCGSLNHQNVLKMHPWSVVDLSLGEVGGWPRNFISLVYISTKIVGFEGWGGGFNLPTPPSIRTLPLITLCTSILNLSSSNAYFRILTAATSRADESPSVKLSNPFNHFIKSNYKLPVYIIQI